MANDVMNSHDMDARHVPDEVNFCNSLTPNIGMPQRCSSVSGAGDGNRTRVISLED